MSTRCPRHLWTSTYKVNKVLRFDGALSNAEVQWADGTPSTQFQGRWSRCGRGMMFQGSHTSCYVNRGFPDIDISPPESRFRFSDMPCQLCVRLTGLDCEVTWPGNQYPAIHDPRLLVACSKSHWCISLLWRKTFVVGLIAIGSFLSDCLSSLFSTRLTRRHLRLRMLLLAFSVLLGAFAWRVEMPQDRTRRSPAGFSAEARVRAQIGGQSDGRGHVLYIV
jgi:hypothetical protein